MAVRTQGDQISNRVVPKPTAGIYVVDMQIVWLATELAAPPVSFEPLIAKRLILNRWELQPRHFVINFTHELPWVPDQFSRQGTVSRAVEPYWRDSFSGLWF
jgi:hypothetical protein